MNIIDVISGSVPAESSIANKIAIKTQAKKYETRVETYINDILEFLSRESEFIDNNLSYSNFTEAHQKVVLKPEDKEFLQNKLYEAVREIPAKLKNAIDEILGSSTSEKEEEKKPEEKKTSVETENSTSENAEQSNVQNFSASIETTAPVSHFGY